MKSVIKIFFNSVLALQNSFPWIKIDVANLDGALFVFMQHACLAFFSQSWPVYFLNVYISKVFGTFFPEKTPKKVFS